MASLAPPDAAVRSKRKQKVNGHGPSLATGEKEVVKSKMPRATNGVFEGGGAVRVSHPSGLRGAEQAVLYSDSPARQAVPFRARTTKLIMRTVFSKLCPACGKHAKQVERELARLEDSHPEDARTVRKLVHHLVEFIRATEQVPSNLDTFLEQKWALDAGNMHMEFSRVAYETFKDNTNWGRIIMFLGFAVSFAVYLEQGLVVGSANSVLEWTCQVIEEDLGQFYLANGGWEGFGEYLDTALKTTRRRKLTCRNRVQGDGEGDEEEDKGSLWHGAVAAGAVAVGAMAALTLRQVFS